MRARGRAIGATTAVVVAVAIGAVTVGALMVSRSDRTGDDGSQAPGTVAPSPFTVPAGGTATPVARERITVGATSHIPQDGSISYVPENTVDGDLQTAWNSDAPDTEGRGETLVYRFSEPVHLKAVRFVNGYVKNDDVFTANHRARDLVIRADNAVQPVMLLDTGDEQEVAFDFGLTSKVEIEVLDIYPGDGFDRPELTADLAITEVAFLAVQP